MRSVPRATRSVSQIVECEVERQDVDTRVAEHTGFFLMGKLIEFDRTEVIFTRPARQETEDYITGRFG